jgi:hypothetical protein
VLDQIEEQRLGPVQVVDDEHDRLGGRERGKHAPHDEEGLLGRCRRSREKRADPAGDAGALAILARKRGLDRSTQHVAARAVVDVQMLA